MVFFFNGGAKFIFQIFIWSNETHMKELTWSTHDISTVVSITNVL